MSGQTSGKTNRQHAECSREDPAASTKWPMVFGQVTRIRKLTSATGLNQAVDPSGGQVVYQSPPALVQPIIGPDGQQMWDPNMYVGPQENGAIQFADPNMVQQFDMTQDQSVGQYPPGTAISPYGVSYDPKRFADLRMSGFGFIYSSKFTWKTHGPPNRGWKSWRFCYNVRSRRLRCGSLIGDRRKSELHSFQKEYNHLKVEKFQRNREIPLEKSLV
eukprot:610036_1